MKRLSLLMSILVLLFIGIASAEEDGVSSRTCEHHENCIDDDPCTKDLCDGRPRMCVNIEQGGCALEGICFAQQTAMYSRGRYIYCSINNMWNVQKGNGEECTGNYQCFSGLCFEHRCKEVVPDTVSQEISPTERSFFKKVFSFFWF